MKAPDPSMALRPYAVQPADRRLFWCVAALFAAILLASLLIPGYLREPSAGLRVFYDWADMVMKGAVPLLAAPGQQAPVIRLSLDAWAPALLAAGICDLASVILILRIAWEVYGREAGLVAGALFTACVALVQGSLTAGEAPALALLLASAYLLLCCWRHRAAGFLAAGLSIGLAAWLEPYAAAILPVCLYVAYRAGGAGAAIWPAAGFVLALPVPALAFVPGSAGALASGAQLVSIACDRPDALVAVASISVSIAVLTSLLPAALLGLAGRRIAVADGYFLFAGLAFLATLLLRHYLTYWIFALPFIVLLCAAQWAKAPDGETLK